MSVVDYPEGPPEKLFVLVCFDRGDESRQVPAERQVAHESERLAQMQIELIENQRSARGLTARGYAVVEYAPVGHSRYGLVDAAINVANTGRSTELDYDDDGDPALPATNDEATREENAATVRRALGVTLTGPSDVFAVDRTDTVRLGSLGPFETVPVGKKSPLIGGKK